MNIFKRFLYFFAEILLQIGMIAGLLALIFTGGIAIIFPIVGAMHYSWYFIGIYGVYIAAAALFLAIKDGGTV